MENFTGTEQGTVPKKIIVHPSYDRKKSAEYDIALIEVLDEWKFNSNVQPIDIPEESYVATGDAVVSGWGHTSEETAERSVVLKKVTVPILTDEVCRESYEELVKDSMICSTCSNICKPVEQLYLM